jgi:hypothetical protein
MFKLDGRAGSNVSVLIVGGNTWSCIAIKQMMASIAPAAPSKWPVIDLVAPICMVDFSFPVKESTALSLRQIANRGRCGVHIQVINLH